MLANWVYDNPLWLVGAAIVCGSVAVGCLGLLACHRLVDLELRRRHNDLAGFLIAIVGILYAVLLAFIAVTAWETYAKAGDAVDAEANAVGNMFFDTAGVPHEDALAYRKLLADYIRLVIDEEWPAQHAGRIGTETYRKGWLVLGNLNVAVARFAPASQGEANMHTELLQDLNLIFSGRRTRQLAAESRIPEVIWWIILWGGILTVGFTYLFGSHSLAMHLTMTSGVTASLALVIVLIVAFDYPFRGEVAVDSEAYRAVLDLMTSYSFPPR